MSGYQTDQQQRVLDILNELDLRLWPNVIAEIMAKMLAGGHFTTTVWRDIRERVESILKDQEDEETDQ